LSTKEISVQSGEPIIAWNIHAKGNVVIVETPLPAIRPRTLLELLAVGAQAASAQVKAAELRTVAGMRATWWVITGRGTGQALDGMSDIPTTQHTVGIPREKDILILVLTSPTDQYPAALKEFEQLLKTLKVEGKQTKEQAEAQ
jgi:hypothetical protein